MQAREIADSAFSATLTDWKKRIEGNQEHQEKYSAQLMKRHYLVGCSAIIFAAISAACTFTPASGILQFIIGTFATISAILSGAMTFYSFAIRAEKGRSCAAGLGFIRREIDILLASPPPTPNARLEALRKLSEEMHKLALDVQCTDPEERPPKFMLR